MRGFWDGASSHRDCIRNRSRTMQRRTSIIAAAVGALALSAFGLSGAAVADPDGQHGTDEGHLIGTGEFGKINLVE